MSDLQAAYLWAQLEAADRINQQRLALWQNYYDALAPLAKAGRIELPSIPDGCVQNAHMFYIKLRDIDDRSALINFLEEAEIMAVFHYIPLHGCPAGNALVSSTVKIATPPRERAPAAPAAVLQPVARQSAYGNCDFVELLLLICRCAKASLWTAASTLVKIGAGLLVGKLLAVSFGPGGAWAGGKFPPVDYRARRACRSWHL